MKPIFFKFNNVQIALLRVDEIKRKFPQTQCENLNSSYSRFIEKKGVMFLKNFYLKGFKFNYTESGKPIINQGGFISVSHSKSLIGIAWSFAHNIALDIEEINPRIEKIETKFINQQELKLISSLVDKIAIWSIKECMVKIMDDKSFNFKTELRAEKINEENWRGIINSNSEHSFKLFEFENNLICYNI